MLDELHIANLRVRFNYLTKGMDDWKMPIKATIPVKHFNEYSLVRSCIRPTVMEMVQWMWLQKDIT